MVFVVVHHDDGATWPGVADDLLFGGRGGQRSVDRRQHQPHLERGALAVFAGHGNFAAQRVGQKLGDGEAKPQPRQRAHAFRLAALEGLVNPGEVAFGNAASGIGDGEGRDLIAIADIEAHRAAIGELDGIRQQVDEDLAQALFIGAHVTRHHAGALMLEGQALGKRLRAEHVDDLVEKVLQVDFVGIDLQAARLDLGNVEKTVDQAGEMFGGAADHADGRLARCWDRVVTLKDLGVTQHGVERRAQFVG